jgi:hypothetical protein
MFSIERRYRVDLGPNGDPSATADIPWICEEPAQYLAVQIYRPGRGALGAGSAQLVRNGAVFGSATAFADNFIVLPAYPLALTATDLELGYLHPQTANQKKLDGVYVFEGGAFVLKKDRNDQVQPMTTAVRVINTDASAKQLLVHWTGLAWRNT